jgi:hypothetical protein
MVDAEHKSIDDVELLLASLTLAARFICFTLAAVPIIATC